MTGAPSCRDTRDRLAADVNAIHAHLHNIPFFQPGPTSEYDELQVLRRWNSHTPMLNFTSGGGYLLRWRGRGTVIDPGVTFLDVFQRPHPIEGLDAHRMDDIDLVVVTHDHADHCEDVGMLLVFLRNYNKWRGEKVEKHTIDFVQSIGAHFRSVILLDNAEMRQFTTAIDMRPPRNGRKAPERPALESKYSMKLAEFCAQHTEVLGDHSALGFRMTLLCEKDGKKESCFVYCDSGDTRYDPEIAENYRKADLLLLHVGSMEDRKGTGEHLYFDGVVKILQGLKDGDAPRLVLLGEWGEEFRGPGYRRRFAELVKREAGYSGAVLPADLGMRIRLDDRCSVLARVPSSAPEWTHPATVRLEDYGQWIEYHRDCPPE